MDDYDYVDKMAKELEARKRRKDSGMSIVLVCGGRDYNDKAFFDRFMDREHGVFVFTHVIHGAYRGADTLAHQWALSRGVQPVACEANWKKQGPKAGPIRNRHMAELRPHWAYAFPGGTGTTDMVNILKEMDIEVITVSAGEKP